MGYGIHVNGTFVVNYFRLEQPPFNFDKIFGKPYPFEDILSIEDFERLKSEHWLPHGDECSCNVSVWENSNTHSIESYVISIFGYLENGWGEDVVDWFIEVCHRLGNFSIGHASLTVESDFTNQTQTMTVINNKISIITYDKQGNIIETDTKRIL